MVKAPHIIVKAPHMMAITLRIMAKAPHTMAKSPHTMAKAPYKITNAPHEMKCYHLRQLWLSIQTGHLCTTYGSGRGGQSRHFRM